MQPGGVGTNDIVSNGDGFTSSMPQICAILATLPLVRYGLKLHTAKLKSLLGLNDSYLERVRQHPNIELRILSDRCVFRFKSDLLLEQAKQFLNGGMLIGHMRPSCDTLTACKKRRKAQSLVPARLSMEHRP